MNFLAHYYFDKQKESNPMYHLGLVFPDFIKYFTLQRFKMSNLNDTEHPLSQGAAMHVKRDGHFHTHPFFDAQCHKLSAMINETAAKSIPKTWFLAHILLEIAIDRVIMDKDIKVLHQFYDELGQVKSLEIKNYFEGNKLVKHDVFMQKLDRFNTQKWLFKYLEDDLLPNSLNSVYFRIGFTQEWNKEINQALVNLLPAVLKEIQSDLHSYPAVLD